MKALALILYALLFSGCVSMASSGAQAIYNHHSLEKSAADQYTTMRASQALYIDSDVFKKSHINVATMNGEVLLTGQVSSEELKAKAEQVVKKATDAKEVHNWLTVTENVPKMTRMKDTWVTTKIKTKLIASGDVDATQVNVTTENGTVFLMGYLPYAQAEAAAQIAADTDGVQQVVKLFSYITISKQPILI